jgi:hypothetical protein
MVKSKLKMGLLYLSLHNHIAKKAGFNKVITRKQFFCILGMKFLIPKSVKPVIIKEMEERKLIKQENKDLIRVLDVDINLERDYNLIYKLSGLL